MAWSSERSGSSYTAPPLGAHYAICIGVYEIGTQTTTYQGKTRTAEKAVLVFELPWATKDDCVTPITTSEFYSINLYEKARLRQHLNGWYGRVLTEQECQAFDPRQLLGAWAQIVIGLRSNGKTEIQTIFPPGDLSQYAMPEPVNTPKFFSVHSWDQAVFDSFSERMQAIIKESKEYQQQFAHQLQASPAPIAGPQGMPRPGAPPMPGGPQPGPRPAAAAPTAPAPPPAAPVPQPAAPSAPAPRPAVGGPGQRPPVPAPTAPGVVDDDIPF